MLWKRTVTRLPDIRPDGTVELVSTSKVCSTPLASRITSEVPVDETTVPVRLASAPLCWTGWLCATAVPLNARARMPRMHAKRSFIMTLPWGAAGTCRVARKGATPIPEPVRAAVRLAPFLLSYRGDETCGGGVSRVRRVTGGGANEQACAASGPASGSARAEPGAGSRSWAARPGPRARPSATAASGAAGSRCLLDCECEA
jgi:hypothetical protein